LTIICFAYKLAASQIGGDMIQLDLFREITEAEIIKIEIYNLKESQDNIRRGLFARHNTLFTMIQNLSKEIEELKNGR